MCVYMCGGGLVGLCVSPLARCGGSDRRTPPAHVLRSLPASEFIYIYVCMCVYVCACMCGCGCLSTCPLAHPP